MDAFYAVVAAHIVTGSVGLASFWVPVLGRKGTLSHRRWGRVFTTMMLATGCFAVGISLTTLVDPLSHHSAFTDAALVRGIFGWMMLYLATLTINLAWYGWLCVQNRRNHRANRSPLNLFLQGAVILLALNCALQGVLIGQPLMLGMSLVGVAAGVTNLWFIYNPNPAPHIYLKEHIKALVGAGISVYTAFFAFGAVRLVPELALNPVFWSIPLVVGLGIILWHRRQVDLAARGRIQAPASPQGQRYSFHVH